MALVDVLVNVLDGLDRYNPLKIDVIAIFPNEVRAVRHYPAIVNLLSIDLKWSSCIAMTKDSVRVLRKSSLILERLWKVLGAQTNSKSSGWVSGSGNSVERRLSMFLGVQSLLSGER